MPLTSKDSIKSLLKKYDARPLKQLGQNFLIDRMVLQKIIKAAEISRDDVILEIGPGIGTLTQELAKRAKKVIAVEKDKRMIEILQETLGSSKNVEIAQGDILKCQMLAPHRTEGSGAGSNVPEGPPTNFWWGAYGAGKCQNQSSKLKTKNYKVVANLPYYIVSPVIRKFLEAENPPGEMILMVQKEVGQRICAKPPKMNLLAVSVQFYAKPEIISYVSKKSFWPEPKVDGSIIKIIPKQRIIPDQSQKEKEAQSEKPTMARPLAAIPAESLGIVGFSDWRGVKVNTRNFRNLFFGIVKAGFAHPRKQLINNLSGGLKIDKGKVMTWLRENNIEPRQRPETLAVENWLSLLQTYGIMDDG